MEIKEKIAEINNLHQRIGSLKDFKKLLDLGSGDSSYLDREGNPKQNYFTGLSLSSKTWTGSDNPEWTRELTNEHDIELLADAMIQHVEIQIKKLEKELANKLN